MIFLGKEKCRTTMDSSACRLCMLWYQDRKDRNATYWLSRACLTDQFTFKKLFFYANLSRLSLGSRLDQIYWAGKDRLLFFTATRRKQKEHISPKNYQAVLTSPALQKQLLPFCCVFLFCLQQLRGVIGDIVIWHPHSFMFTTHVATVTSCWC